MVVFPEEPEHVAHGELDATMLRHRPKLVIPGPDGIPGRGWGLALNALNRPRALFDICLAQGRFPHKWKTGNLVLLRKEGWPAGLPLTYRPIYCFL